MSQNSLERDVSICFATLHRPHCAKRLVASIRQRYPTMRILVGEQCGTPSESELGDLKADVFHYPVDFGVSATRNALIQHVTTPYFVLCDDDFIFSHDTDLAPGRKVLRADEKIAVVGGLLYDLFKTDEINRSNPRMWERFINFDRSRRRLILTAIQRCAPKSLDASGVQYFATDTALNWAMMRTAYFHAGLAGWDPQFKISGEHEDFYLSLKTNTDLKTAYCPSMVAYHHHPKSDDRTYQQLRARLDGWSLFRDKWQIDEVVDDTLEGGYCIDTEKLEVSRTSFSATSFLERAQSQIGRVPLKEGRLGIDQHGRFYHTQAVNPPSQERLFVNPATGRIEASSMTNEIAKLQRDLRKAIENAGEEQKRYRIMKRDLDRTISQHREVLDSTIWRASAPLRQLLSKSVVVRKAVGYPVHLARRGVTWWRTRP